MGSFFHGWRRKTGVLTLVMACVFTGAWVRSQSVEDSFHLYSGMRECFAGSTNGGLYFNLLHFDDKSEMIPNENIRFWKSTERSKDRFIGVEQLQIEWDWTWCGFSYVGAELGFVVIVPYLSIVIPLTLISAFLLLTKPHKSNQTKISEPIPENVA